MSARSLGRRVSGTTAWRAVAAITALAIVGLTSQAAAMERLTGAQLESLLAGSVATSDGSGAIDVTIRFGRDGKMKGRASTLIFSSDDTGNWEVVGDTVCLEWAKWQDAKRECVYVERVGNAFSTRSSDGEISSTFMLDMGSDQQAALPTHDASVGEFFPPVSTR